MSTFEELTGKWELLCDSDPEVSSVLEEKLSPLLNHKEEEFVKQGMELLTQFGGCSLVFILEDKEGSFEITKKYLGNVRAVEQCVIEEVTKEESDWFALFDTGSFDGMFLRSMEHTEWSSLSENLQQRLLQEVRKMVEVPGKKYSIGKYQVTQALWESVMEDNPSWFKGSSGPVENVNWFDCVEFCNKLSEKEGLEKAYTINGKKVECNFDSNGYRLPTADEWEYCARSGESFIYSGSNNCDEVAWTSENSNSQTHVVGQKKANGFGLYDMSGNVDEWCWDKEVSLRVSRGGCWCYGARDARVSYRNRNLPSYRFDGQGFRLFRTIR